MQNLIKTKLKSGKTVTGCFIGFYSNEMVEMLGHSGFDFVVIDNEHGAFSWREVENLIRSAELAGISPIVRVAYGPSDIQKALDRGAVGLHVPMVNNKEEAEAAVRRAKFPPLGQRGTAYSVRSSKYGKGGGHEYIKKCNEHVFIAVHIETPQAVDNIEEIASVPGIDLCFVGPTDLSVTMGYAKEGPGHPEVQKAMNYVMEKCNELGVPVGTLTGNAPGVTEREEWGARYIGVGITSVLSAAFDNIVNNGAKNS